MDYCAGYGKILEKLPPDFFQKNPTLVVVGGLFVIALPGLCNGAKLLTKECSSNFRYWVDAKYGKPSTMVLEATEVSLLSEATAA